MKSNLFVRSAPLAVFLFVFAAHVSCPVITASDSRWFLPVAESIIRHGDADINEYGERIRGDGYAPVEGLDGGLYNHFPIGTALLSLPMVWGVDTAMRVFTGESFEQYLQHDRAEWVERLIASVFVAMSAVFVFLISRGCAARIPEALFITFIYAFCTPAWSTASRALWQHGPVLLLLSSALYLLMRGRENDRFIPLLFPVLFLAYIVRPTTLVTSFCLALVAFVKHPRRSFAGLLFMLPMAGLFVAYNLGVYGSLLPPYFQAARITFGPFFAEALAANLFSPNRGLFVFSPVLCLAFFGAWRLVRNGKFGLIEWSLASAVFLHWILISMFPHWWGGHCTGPRFFTDAVPFMVYFLVPVVNEVRLLEGRRRLLQAFVILLLCAWSFLVQFRCSVCFGTVEWNYIPASVDEDPGRVWDWGDVQFLRRQER